MTVDIAVKLDLAEGRADCGCLDSVFVEQILCFKNFLFGQNRNVFLVDVSDLNMRYSELVQSLKLFHKAVGIFVGECRKDYLCHNHTLISGSSSAHPLSSERIMAFIMKTGEMNSS